jgi:hypothetical protein
LLGVSQYGHVKLVRADDKALRTDAEQLAFDRVEQIRGIVFFLKYFVKGPDEHARYLSLSDGISFEPSVIHMLCMHGCPEPCHVKGDFAQALTWSIQKRRTPSSGLARVMSSFAIGCPKQLG